MSCSRTTTTVQTGPNGAVTVTTVTEPVAPSAAHSTIPPTEVSTSPPALTGPPEDPAQAAWLEAARSLKRGLAPKPFQRTIAGPQVDEGTLNIMPPLPGRLTYGRIYSDRISTNPDVYTEHWVVMDPAFFGGLTELRLASLNTDSFTWNDVVSGLKSTHNGQNGARAWQDFRYAEVEVTYLEPPTQTQINNMPDMPGQHERRIYDLLLNSPNHSNVVVGAVYLDIYPIGSMNRVEHWRLFDNYSYPSGGEQPDRSTGTTVTLRPRMPSQDPNDSFPYTISPLLPTVKEFLSEVVNQGGHYIQTEVTWGSLP